MDKKITKDIQINMIKICDAFSALEYAYKKSNDPKDLSDVLAIIGIAADSGMSAYEKLSNAIDKALAK